MATKTVAESNGPKGRKGIEIRGHGELTHFKTNTQKGTRKFEQAVVFPSAEIFRETTQKYMGQKINEQTKLSEPVYDTRSFINVRGLLKRRFILTIPEESRHRFRPGTVRIHRRSCEPGRKDGGSADQSHVAQTTRSVSC